MTLAATLLVLLASALPASTAQEARWSLGAASVEVGEPFELVLELFHDEDEPALELAPGLDDSWVLLDERRTLARSVPGEPARLVTRRAFDVASLEPGERRLDLPSLGAAAADAAPLVVEVRGVLAPGEDAPRPLRGLPDDFGIPPPPAGANLLGGALAALAVLAAGGFLWLRLRRRAPAERAPSTPLERLRALAEEPVPDDEALRSKYFALSRLVREATDAALAAERPALTDEEWLAALSGAGPVTPPAREALARVLARCGSVKYAGERPTDWSAQETFTAARRALELVGARAPAGEGQP